MKKFAVAMLVLLLCATASFAAWEMFASLFGTVGAENQKDADHLSIFVMNMANNLPVKPDIVLLYKKVSGSWVQHGSQKSHLILWTNRGPGSYKIVGKLKDHWDNTVILNNCKAGKTYSVVLKYAPKKLVRIAPSPMTVNLTGR